MAAGALESRQWSASTLANGMGTVMADVKLEPWTDGDDDADLLRQLKDPIIKGSYTISIARVITQVKNSIEPFPMVKGGIRWWQFASDLCQFFGRKSGFLFMRESCYERIFTGSCGQAIWRIFCS